MVKKANTDHPPSRANINFENSRFDTKSVTSKIDYLGEIKKRFNLDGKIKSQWQDVAQNSNLTTREKTVNLKLMASKLEEQAKK